MHRQIFEERESLFGILAGVKRLDSCFVVVVEYTFAAITTAHQILGVFFMDVSTVEEHGATQVLGRGSGMDRTMEALFDEVREVARMIDMGVRENDTIYRTRVEWEATIAVAGLRAATLEEPAIEQDAAIALPHFMHGSSHCACGAPKINFHG